MRRVAPISGAEYGVGAAVGASSLVHLHSPLVEGGRVRGSVLDNVPQGLVHILDAEANARERDAHFVAHPPHHMMLCVDAAH